MKSHKRLATSIVMSLCVASTVGYSRYVNVRLSVPKSSQIASLLAGSLAVEAAIAIDSQLAQASSSQKDSGEALAETYEIYSQSVRDNLLGPLGAIAYEPSGYRTEEFVSQQAGLDIVQTSDDTKSLQSAIDAAIEQADTDRAQSLRDAKQALNKIQNSILVPLMEGDPPESIFIVAGAIEKTSSSDPPDILQPRQSIEDIQENLYGLASSLEAEESFGLYNPSTFAEIEQFVESQNSRIKDSLTMAQSTLDSDSTAQNSSNQDSERNWLVLFLWISAFLIATGFVAKNTFSVAKNAFSFISQKTPAQKTAQTRNPAAPARQPSSHPTQPPSSQNKPVTSVVSPPETASTRLQPDSEYEVLAKAVVELQQEIARSKGQTNDESEAVFKTSREVEESREHIHQMLSIISEENFIDLYNRDFMRLSKAFTVTDQTKASLKNYIQGSHEAIQLEARSKGKYWAIPRKPVEGDTASHYLVLRKDIQLNQQNLSTVNACFIIKNKVGAKNGFDIVRPAVLKPVHNSQLWTLVRKGEVRFKETKKGL